MRSIHLLVFLAFIGPAPAFCGVYPSEQQFLGDVSWRDPAEQTDWQLFSSWNRWQEDGRSFLSSAEKQRFATGADIVLPGGCMLEVEITRWDDTFDGPGDYKAEGSAYRAVMPVGGSLDLGFSGEIKDYDRPEAEDSKPFGVEATWHLSEDSDIKAAFRRRQEAANFYALLQGIEEDCWSMSFVRGDAVKLMLDAEYLEYTDDNEALRISAALSRSFDKGGMTFSPGVKLQYRDARQEALFLFVPGGGVIGITFPYWAPKEYLVSSAGMDFSLRKSSQFDLAARAAVTYDSDEETGIEASVSLTRKYLFLKGQVFRSDAWDADGVSVGAVAAF